VTPYLSIGPPEPAGVVGLPQPAAPSVLAAVLLFTAAVVVAFLVWREVAPRPMVLEDSLDITWLPADAAAIHDGDEELDIIEFGRPPTSRPSG
jgi:hypothetical protein